MKSHSPLRPVIATLLAGGLALQAIPLAGQQEKGLVHEATSVTAIEIPVNVIGKDGKPVPGLTAKDFELTDDGKKQEISAVDVVDLRGRPAAEIPGVARRHWLLVFDTSYSSPRGIARAREGAAEFVKTATSESDLVGVAALSAEAGWKLLLNFTRDRHQLAAAVAAAGATGAGANRTDPLAFAFVVPGSENNAAIGGGANASAVRETNQDVQRSVQTATDNKERARVAQFMTTLGSVARALDSVRGRKHVLFFSEGFESRLLGGSEAARPMGGAEMAAGPSNDTANEQVLRGQTWKVDSDSRFGSSATRNTVGDALAVFRRSDTVLHAVDVTGLKSDSSDVSNRKGASGRDTLFTISKETEGELVQDANQLSGELAKVADRTGLVYVLVYQPKNLSKPGTFHALKVKTTVAGARVSARSGYYEPRPYAALSALEKMLATGDVMTGGAENSLRLSLLAAPFSSGTDRALVPVVLEVPGRELLRGPGSAAAQDSVQLYAYVTRAGSGPGDAAAGDSAGTLVDYRTSEVALDLAKAKASLESGGIKYYGAFSLAPGDYTVRAVARSVATGRAGIASASLHVPAFAGGPAVVLPPIFQDAPSRWVMVRATSASEPSEYPFVVGGETFVPWAAPVLEAGTEVKVAIFTYNYPAGAEGGKPPALQLAPAILGNGRAWPASGLRLLGQSGVEKGGARKILLAFKPDGLPPGKYRLKLGVSESTSGAAADGVAAFEVK